MRFVPTRGGGRGLPTSGTGRTLARMSLRRRTRGTTVLTGVAALLLTLLAVLGPQPAQAHHAGSSPGPVNAQSTFKWGRPQWQDDFEGARTKKFWHVTGRGHVQNQHGMLTLNTARRGDTRATLSRAGHRTGRWEIRLRSRRFGSGGANYQVMTQLVPSGGRAQHCGARNVGLEQYRLSHRRAKFFVRTRPARQFTDHQRLNLGNNRWHTYAVEVTRKRNLVVRRRPRDHLGASPGRPPPTCSFTARFTSGRRSPAPG